MLRHLGWAAVALMLGGLGVSTASKPSIAAAPKPNASQASVPKVKESPSKKPRKASRCKKGEIQLRAADCPKNARCRAHCFARPRSGTSVLCPEGQRWEAMPCPPNARCLIGGRCKAAPGKKTPKVTPPKTTPPKTTPSKTTPPKAPTKTTPKCGLGRVPTRVMCVRAPCPVLCLPARLDPSLKASPKVKVL